jgi:hypothetical protein
MTENKRFGLVFAKTGSINSGTSGNNGPVTEKDHKGCFSKLSISTIFCNLVTIKFFKIFLVDKHISSFKRLVDRPI